MMRGGMGGGARFRTRAAMGMVVAAVAIGSAFGGAAAGAAPAKPTSTVKVTVPSVVGHQVTADFSIGAKLSSITSYTCTVDGATSDPVNLGACGSATGSTNKSTTYRATLPGQT